ncbi:SRPBCC domain-containing protein [Polaromonas sp.]|uniref:SRPBCC family protein n=1 Tax=Polaromonas sp. TaxID=1869339 RepID=UPI0032650682
MTEAPPDAGPLRVLPYSRWWPLAAGVLAGLLLRLVFSGKPGNAYAAMMGSFIYLSPVVVGAVTVYVAEKASRRSWAYYFWAPFVANIFFVLGTLLIMVEGLICAVVIIPMFALVGSIGGLTMGLVCRATNWPRPTLYGLWALPLILGAVETHIPVPQREHAVEQTMLIQATPERIWQEIHDARAIQPGEVDAAWFFRIGVPLPHAGISQTSPSDNIRVITMGKDIHFEQVVTDWQENRHVRWTHRYAADSFPKYALDDHVVLGGHYFDITSTAYSLTPRGNATELHVRMDYRVSTPFNWYADPVSKFLLTNFESVLLRFYQHRSEVSHPMQQTGKNR